MIKLLKKISRPWVVSMLVALMAAPPADAVQFRRTLHLSADPWCPISCNPSSNNPGIGVELARAIYEPLGYRIVYTVEPWARTLDDARHGKVDAVIGADRSDDPTLVFPHKPLAHVNYDFYALTRSGLKNASLDTLKTKRIGAITGYGYGTLDPFIKAQRTQRGLVQDASGEDALQQNIMKLLAGRIDVIIESSTVMDYRLAQVDLGDVIEHIGGQPSGHIYLAFSPALPQSKKLAEQFDAGILRLTASGELETIYQRYHLPSPLAHAH